MWMLKVHMHSVIPNSHALCPNYKVFTVLRLKQLVQNAIVVNTCINPNTAF